MYTWCGRGPGNINGLFSVKVVIFRETRDSAGFVTMEEGLISRGGRNLRLPLREGKLGVALESLQGLRDLT